MGHGTLQHWQGSRSQSLERVILVLETKLNQVVEPNPHPHTHTPATASPQLHNDA
jgi:hypothetical protein